MMRKKVYENRGSATTAARDKDWRATLCLNGINRVTTSGGLVHVRCKAIERQRQQPFNSGGSSEKARDHISKWRMPVIHLALLPLSRSNRRGSRLDRQV